MERRKTPIMGWASWNCFRTNISEAKIKEQARHLVETGLADCGYNYVNIDDGFFGGRDEGGTIVAHKERFPNGMKVVSDYIHSLGLQAGIYADGGDNTCGFYYDNEGKNGQGVGLYGYEEKDLKTYLVEWGYDFIKVDWCGGLRIGLEEEMQYTKIGKMIEDIRTKYDKNIVYNVCRWQFPGEWVAEVADSWRTGADINPNFSSVMQQIDMIKPLREYCGPGHVNDLDMLQIGNGMSYDEDVTHFIMWCMMSTPLMLGCNLSTLSPKYIELLTNKELIAINQDVACLQAFVVKDSYQDETLQWEIWVKNLGKDDSTEKAVVFLNRSNEAAHISASLNELGLATDDNAEVRVRNVLEHCDLSFDGDFSLEVKGHACIAFRITAPKAVKLKDHAVSLKNAVFEQISMKQARNLVGSGVLLIDVRTAEEYAIHHLEGAINIPYTEIHAATENGRLSKESSIIVYCRTGKRSMQAAKSLFYLGYHDIKVMVPENI